MDLIIENMKTVDLTSIIAGDIVVCQRRDVKQVFMITQGLTTYSTTHIPNGYSNGSYNSIQKAIASLEEAGYTIVEHYSQEEWVLTIVPKEVS